MKRYRMLMMTLFIVSRLHAQDNDLVQYVNTLQGSHNTEDFSHGRCSPLVGLPHGVTLWSPMGAGFTGGGISIKPILGDPGSKNAVSDAKDITAKPNYYKASFDNGITTETTGTERCGYFKITYPTTQKAFLVINGRKTGDITIDAGKGTITSTGGEYFIMRADYPFISSGQVIGGKGTYVEFSKGSKVQFSIALSHISLEQAQITLDREITPYSFDQIKDAGYKVWNKLLNKIIIEGSTPEQKRTFYSCLYRANIRPHKTYEIDKAGNPHFYAEGKVHDGYNYEHPTFWDTYHSHSPLLNILDVAGQKEYLPTLQASVPLTGWLPNGMIGNHAIAVFTDAWAKGVRTFNPDSVLKYFYHEATNSKLDASNGYFVEHQRGVGRFGHEDYFAKGYIPYPENTTQVTESTSRTLEYCYDDFCAYQLAKMTGNKFYEDIFKKQLYNYKNVFDPSDHFMKARYADGSWQKNFNPYEWGGPFVEGNAWQWKWSVSQDVQGLIDLIGGDKKFISELDELFSVKADSALFGGYGYRIHEINESVAADMGQYGGINEPGFHIIYLYDYAGQPWKCQKLIRQSVVKLFNSGPDGFMGDEDGGAVSSWYVFSTLGFYPITPGTDQYEIGSPLFKKATINLENGKKFVIEADNNTANNVYIQKATLNGKSYGHNWITHDDIMNGGTLKFEMGNKPDMKRGTGKEDRPFALSIGE